MSDTKTVYIAVVVPETWQKPDSNLPIEALPPAFADAKWAQVYDTDDRILSLANDIKSRDYRDTVNSIAEEIEAAVKDGEVNWSRLAYAALMADVREAFTEIDINEDDLGWMECDECPTRCKKEDSPDDVRCQECYDKAEELTDDDEEEDEETTE